jgi:DNA-binding transcriptional ArsR family regulator
VTELVAEVGLSQPLVSWHVGRLRAAGLVATRRVGRETLCSVLPDAFAAFAARQRQVLGLAGVADPPATEEPARSAAS